MKFLCSFFFLKKIKSKIFYFSALANLGSKAPMTAPQNVKSDEMDIEQKVPSLPSDIQSQMAQKSEE